MNGITRTDEATDRDPRRQPGQWPITPHAPVTDEDTEPARNNKQRARFHVTLGALRAALEEEPSPNLVRAAGRRWIAAAIQVIDEVASATRNEHSKEREQ